MRKTNFYFEIFLLLFYFYYFDAKSLKQANALKVAQLMSEK